MYHTILVPSDGSKRAEVILPHVEELAQCADAKVILLRVVDPGPVAPSPEGSRLALDSLESEQRTREAEDC